MFIERGFLFSFSSNFGIVHFLTRIALQKNYGRKLSYDLDLGRQKSIDE